MKAKKQDPQSPILEIQVSIQGAYNVTGKHKEVTMIPFVGESKGPFFFGETIGTGVDTQKKTSEGFTLSARYMLEGRDYKGNPCRVFIENQGNYESGFKPIIVTDSEALAEWEEKDLTATITPIEGGVMIKIFMEG